MWLPKPKLFMVSSFAEKFADLEHSEGNEHPVATTRIWVCNMLSEKRSIHKSHRRYRQNQPVLWESGLVVMFNQMSNPHATRSPSLHRCVQFVESLPRCTLMIGVSIYYLNNLIWLITRKCNLNSWSPPSSLLGHLGSFCGTQRIEETLSIFTLLQLPVMSSFSKSCVSFWYCFLHSKQGFFLNLIWRLW